jgi:peptidoglycan/xylan/chitin deacetylase (PgdA/CDA1 family)
MYHGTPDQKPASSYSIQSRLFKQHIRHLKQNGWHSACIRDLATPDLLQPKTIMITFDDGYLDNFENAYLPLMEHNMRATWFITTNVIGSHAHWMGEFDEMRMLTEEHLAEMTSNGMEIGSHTCSHPDLTSLAYTEQLKELQRSREQLEDIVDQPVTSLAYPFGRYNTDSLQAAEKSGYTFACSTRSGHQAHSESMLQLRRVTIFDGDSVSTLARKLVFADNDVSWKKMARYYTSRLASKLTG